MSVVVGEMFNWLSVIRLSLILTVVKYDPW